MRIVLSSRFWERKLNTRQYWQPQRCGLMLIIWMCPPKIELRANAAKLWIHVTFPADLSTQVVPITLPTATWTTLNTAICYQKQNLMNLWWSLCSPRLHPGSFSSCSVLLRVRQLELLQSRFQLCRVCTGPLCLSPALHTHTHKQSDSQTDHDNIFITHTLRQSEDRNETKRHCGTTKQLFLTTTIVFMYIQITLCHATNMPTNLFQDIREQRTSCSDFELTWRAEGI